MNDPIQLAVTLMPSGEVQLAGPINNKLVCYGLLGMAYEALLKYHAGAKEVGPSIAIAKEVPHVG